MKIQEERNRKVVVAMSGGVDSSVAAALLVEQGYEVIGMMLRLWNQPGEEAYNRCCTPEAMDLAAQVPRKLDIPFYPLDVRDTFYRKIVLPFIDDYQNGKTPNPCMNCNRHIRFGALQNQALGLGAKYLATGHYAQRVSSADGKFSLFKGADHHKDQSYVLSVLNQDQLSQALFPVGSYTKPEIRKLAEKFDLPVANRPDSQDLCFLGQGDYRDFLDVHIIDRVGSGNIVDSQGETLGKHNGLENYTIGQRKGLGIAYSEPLYVIKKDLVNNTLIVGTKSQSGRDTLHAAQVNWISGDIPQTPFNASIKIRYQSREQTGLITPINEKEFQVKFYDPIKGITPGQAAVIYQGEQCLANGTIQSYD